MRHNLVVLSLAAALGAVAAVPAWSQVVIYDGQQSDSYPVDGNTEANFLHAWNRHHDNQSRWSDRGQSFGPDDVINLLEDRGYRVRNVRDVGERFWSGQRGVATGCS
jgi:hypothetical protein